MESGTLVSITTTATGVVITYTDVLSEKNVELKLRMPGTAPAEVPIDLVLVVPSSVLSSTK